MVTLKAFKNILITSGLSTYELQTDEGNDCLNKNVFNKRHALFYVKSGTKAETYERFDRTLQTKCGNIYFTDRNTSSFIDIFLTYWNPTIERVIEI